MTNALSKIQRVTAFHRNGVICDDEMINAFVATVLEADLDCVTKCASELSPALHSRVVKCLREFAERGYFDDRHAYINDGRTMEQRRKHYHEMEAHYKEVVVLLLDWLGDESGGNNGN